MYEQVPKLRDAPALGEYEFSTIEVEETYEELEEEFNIAAEDEVEYNNKNQNNERAAKNIHSFF